MKSQKQGEGTGRKGDRMFEKRKNKASANRCSKKKKKKRETAQIRQTSGDPKITKRSKSDKEQEKGIGKAYKYDTYFSRNREKKIR